VVKKELMRERSAAEHDPAQAGEQYVSLAINRFPTERGHSGACRKNSGLTENRKIRTT